MSRHHDDGSFAHSMTDLMAGVAVTFLLLAAIFMVQADALKREAEKKKHAAEEKAKELRTEPAAKRELDDLRRRLEGTLANRKAQVTPDAKDPLLLLVVFESRDWFPSGTCTPRRAQADDIRTIVSDVFTSVCDTGYQHIESIILEGHTDNKSYCPGGAGASERCGAVDACSGVGGVDETAGFRNNVRLSAARAQEVFFLAREGIDAGAVTSCLEQKFLISGRGPVQPRDGRDWKTSASEETLRDDRRVVLKVRFRQRDTTDATADGGAP